MVPTPKVLENLPARLKAEARRQVLENGYAAMTMRSVAGACGVSVGVVYNYYPSKEALTAAFMLVDWRQCLAAVEQDAAAAADAQGVLAVIHRELLRFLGLYSGVFRDAAAVGFAGVSGQYHTMLLAQLARPLRRFCADDFTAEFIAEALLTWTVAGKPLPEVSRLLQKLL